MNNLRKCWQIYKKGYSYCDFYNPKLSIKIKLVLAYAFILSQLRSFLFIWHPHNNYNKIVELYHETTKIVLGARKSTPLATLYTLTGWLTLKDAIFVQTFKILLPNGNCPVCNKPETVLHYLLECNAFTKQREILKHKLRNLNHPFTIRYPEPVF